MFTSIEPIFTLLGLLCLILLILLAAFMGHFARTGRLSSTEEQAEEERLQRLAEQKKNLSAKSNHFDSSWTPVDLPQNSDFPETYIPPDR